MTPHTVWVGGKYPATPEPKPESVKAFRRRRETRPRQSRYKLGCPEDFDLVARRIKAGAPLRIATDGTPVSLDAARTIRKWCGARSPNGRPRRGDPQTGAEFDAIHGTM